MKRVFIGGGQEYHGETAERDKAVVALTAAYLFNRVGNDVEIVTGGMQGIPDDFAHAWHKAGGKHVLCVVSSEHEERYLARKLPFKHVIAGVSQEARRLAVTRLPGIVCAIFVQGGKYSTHEMKLLDEANVPIVSYWGSGEAAGGDPATAYPEAGGYVWNKKPLSVFLTSTDPHEDAHHVAKALVDQMKI